MDRSLKLFTADATGRLVDRPNRFTFTVRLDSPRCISVGALGEIPFDAGHYLYVGSAMGTMHSRTARHQRRHIDYLRAQVEWAAVYRIHSHRRLECTIATTLARIYPAPVPATSSIPPQTPARIPALWRQCSPSAIGKG